ncbi:MAG: tRNA uridine-5-carboxymethylaminomethyl(34) synthesis GTPase MnmE [Clostridiales bacterium]|nr:tRNA uridine-5-carboxymethylaminomethyl(34) synthesis GTPase MnmE [Clostridiales bacterium]
MPDTIAAIATIQAPSAIGIVRLTGPDTRRILDGVFAPANGRPMSAQTPRKLVFGRALDRSGGVIDEALAVLFPGPNSYTGEDCAEIHCHGSPVVLDEVLAAAFARGARQARGGEFTQRAFLSGRMDLIQAESVADLIDAESAGAARNAVGQLQGRMSRSVGGIYDALMDVVSRFYAIVDYPDEEIEPLQQAQIEQTLAESAERLDALLATFSRGRLLKSGVPAVILGKPNAGKSSLLNALLGYDRAIVTDIAGTTRDTVEEKVLVGSVLLRLCDTAGIRDAADTVERLGVERAQQAAQRAELALLVLDGSAPLTREDEEAIAAARQARRMLVLVNKADLPQVLDTAALRVRFGEVIPLSAHSGAGVDALCRAVEELFAGGETPRGELLTNARQAESAQRALDAVRRAEQALRSGLSPDAVLTDAEEALEALAEFSGKRVRDDLVATIFSRFCVGK